MIAYVWRRLATLVPVWLAITFVAFSFVHIIPGGPFDTGAVRSLETDAILRARFNLDEPFIVQYLLYLKGVFQGDLGTSIAQRGLNATSVILDRFPTSAILGLAGIAVAIAVGVPAGIIASVSRNRRLDHSVMTLATIGYSIPNFVLSILFILTVGRWLGLPLGGWGDPKQIILPAIALGLPWAGLLARLTRASMLDVLQADYITTATAKGATATRVVIRHAFRSAVLPLVTVVPLLVAELITGSLVIEKVFGIPGLGQFVVDSVVGRDYSLMLGFIVFYATLIFVANMIVDISYAWLDPRIRLE